MTFVSRLCLALCFAVVLIPRLAVAQETLPTVDGLSTTAPATPAPPDNEGITLNVYVPKTCAALEVSASLLYLQPSGNLNYGTLVNPFPFLQPHWSNQAVNPGFTPAFNVGTRYTFDCGGAIALDWTHFNSYDHGMATTPVPYPAPLTLTGPANMQALGPPFLIGPPIPYNVAYAVAHFDYDAINLQGEVALNIGRRIQLRPFAGIQGTRIDETLTTNFRSNDGSFTSTYITRSTFNGVGPRLGMGLHYLAGNLDLLGNIGGGTILGPRRSHMEFYANSPTNAAQGLIPNGQYLLSPTSTQAIPFIDAKLGGSYSIAIGRFGTLKCEAGYQAAVYINAINQYALTEVENSLTADAPGKPETTGSAVFLRSAAEYQSNFLVHGPYLSFTFQF
jgi:hypothetical protein